MNTLKKILGISSLVIMIAVLLYLVKLLYSDEIEWISFLALLIPCYVIFHYLISTKLGFDESNVYKQRFYVIGLIFSFILLVLIPFTVYFFEQKEAEELAEIQRQKEIEYQNKIQSLKEPKDLGKDTTVFNIECSLKTRFIDEKLEYIFTAKYLKERKPEIRSFTIKLLEEYGFVVEKIVISDWTRMLDPDSEILRGYGKRGSIPFENIDKYGKITSYEVSIITK